jgi:cytochrome b
MTPGSAGPPPPPTRVPVWDRPLRLLHWALVLSVAGAAASALWWGRLHQPLGYATLVVVALRLLWGFAGSRQARWAQFVRSPRHTGRYLRRLVQGREPRHLGHNPLGGWMVLALLACISGLGLTGWLYTSDALWGDERVELAHRALAWALLALVLLHLAGVLFTSLRHRENLVRAMVDGMKRPAAPHDVA